MFFSTRNQKIKKTASQAILEGLSGDGGLFLPESIPELKADESLLKASYSELAFKVLRLYLDDFTDEEINSAVSQAYDKSHFEEEILKVRSFDSFSILELFHGQTLTFKDMALSLLPYLMKIAKSKHPEDKDVKILTATSGDTGSAVLSSFSLAKDINVSILYPEGGISPIQEKQMLYFTNNHARAYALANSNFDTCQSLVKSLLIKGEDKGYTSANSINIGRLLPQIVYYYYSYLDLVRQKKIALGELTDYIVPTGNFGDIFAGYLAKRMGLPINKLVIASNENRILTDFFSTGVYDLNRPFIKTNSPSMDILISSNLERLLFYTLKTDNKVVSIMKDLHDNKSFKVDALALKELQGDFMAFSCSGRQTQEAIKNCYDSNKELLDPHSAVGYHAYLQYFRYGFKSYPVLIATASPLKFPETICHAFNLKYSGNELEALKTMKEAFKLELPSSLEKVLSCRTPKLVKRPSEIESELFYEHRYTISCPATSANLGPGFDVMGLALSLYNTFLFQRSDKTELKGFPDLKGQPNLVYEAYQKAFEVCGLKPLDVIITQLQNDIPVSRGLGSSSSCIIAGLLGADYMMHNRFSLKEIYNLAAKIEGHPDNIAPCLFGGLVANLKNGADYESYNLKPSSDWRFILIVPDEEVSTAKAREMLPKEYPLAAISQNVSHAILLPEAFKKGDIVLLRKTLGDLIHVPYRKKLISDYSVIESKVSGDYGFPLTISGSGSAMIAFYLSRDESQADALLEELKGLKLTVKTRFIKARMDNRGAYVKREDSQHE